MAAEVDRDVALLAERGAVPELAHRRLPGRPVGRRAELGDDVADEPALLGRRHAAVRHRRLHVRLHARCPRRVATSSAEARRVSASDERRSLVGPSAHASTIGSSSAGAAPCRITPSAPRSNCRCTTSTQRCGDPVAAGASHDSGMSVATCSSSVGRRVLVDRALEAGDERIGAEAGEWFGIPTVRRHHQVAVGLEVRRHAPDGLLQLHRLGQVVADRRQARPHLRPRPGRARPARPRPSPCARSARASRPRRTCAARPGRTPGRRGAACSARTP